MNIRILAPGLLVLALAACDNNAPPPPSPPHAPGSSTGAQTAIGRKVEQAMAEAREKLATENITLNGKDGGMLIGRHTIGSHDPNLPKAEITPQGDFLIDGKAVAVNDAQRRLLLEYRGHIIDIAGIGMSIGAKGADLGMRAAGEAVKGIFTGNADQVGQKIEAEAEKLKVEAMAICTQLTPLLASQNALAAALPEFKPYARMEQSDIDECMDDENSNDAASAAERAQVQSDIRDGIRQSIRSAVQGAGMASSGTGDVTTLNGVRFLLPVGRVVVNNVANDSTLEVGSGLHVRLEGDTMSVNGTRYARPARGSEVDLRRTNAVLVDGKTPAAL